MPASSLPTCSRAPASIASQPEKPILFKHLAGRAGPGPCQSIEAQETIETIGEIARKTSFATDLGDGFKTSQVPPTTRTGCPPSGSLYVWAKRTMASATAPSILLTHPLFRIMGRYHRHID